MAAIQEHEVKATEVSVQRFKESLQGGCAMGKHNSGTRGPVSETIPKLILDVD